MSEIPITQRNIPLFRSPLRFSSAVAVLLLAAVALAVPETAQARPSTVVRACAAPARPGFARCQAMIRTDVTGRAGNGTPFGYGPADLRDAYALPSGTAGAGLTVALIDAYDNPTAEADLAVYRAQFGLPECRSATGCFRKVDEHGGRRYPQPDAGWAAESALDIEMVSAACPRCRILLVEADQAAIEDLSTAVGTAVGLGAVAVSNSYGAAEWAVPAAIEAAFDRPGVAITASSGDSGYGVQYPAAARHVIAVGGTSLRRAGNGRGWAETAWGGSGAGCSRYQAKP
jgi:subtilase family serine protease